MIRLRNVNATSRRLLIPGAAALTLLGGTLYVRHPKATNPHSYPHDKRDHHHRHHHPETETSQNLDTTTATVAQQQENNNQVQATAFPKGSNDDIQSTKQDTANEQTTTAAVATDKTTAEDANHPSEKFDDFEGADTASSIFGVALDPHSARPHLFGMSSEANAMTNSASTHHHHASDDANAHLPPLNMRDISADSIPSTFASLDSATAAAAAKFRARNHDISHEIHHEGRSPENHTHTEGTSMSQRLQGVFHQGGKTAGEPGDNKKKYHDTKWHSWDIDTPTKRMYTRSDS